MNALSFPSVVDVTSILTACGVFGDERDQILDLCHPRHDADVLRISDGTQWDAFVHHASQAQRLIEYQPLMIPWLAQNEEYVTAYWSPRRLPAPGPWAPKLNHGDAIKLRVDLDRIELLVHEWALRAPIGTHALRSVQMRGLLTLSAAENVSLRAIPATRVVPAIALSGFTVLEYSHRPTLVYREEPTSGVFFDAPELVDAHLKIVAQLRQNTLSLSGSRELLEQIRDDPAPEVAPVDSLRD